MDSSFSADEHFRLGLEALERNEHADAMEQFGVAHRLDPARPIFRSYYGLCLGVAEKRFDKALAMCRSAAKEEFFNPALYHNLARVHLAFGFKAEGIRYLRRGLMIDPGNDAILSDLARLGVRRQPVFGFLQRRNLVNRWFGFLLKRTQLESSSALEPFRI